MECRSLRGFFRYVTGHNCVYTQLCVRIGLSLALGLELGSQLNIIA